MKISIQSIKDIILILLVAYVVWSFIRPQPEKIEARVTEVRHIADTNRIKGEILEQELLLLIQEIEKREKTYEEYFKSRRSDTLPAWQLADILTDRLRYSYRPGDR